MLISILEKINEINEMIFAPLDGIIEKLPLEEWITDAIVDSLHLLPFLFFIFVLIEIIEFYFSDKMDACIKKARKRSVAVGALASIFPQCGFSVIASSLYSRRMITRGCLIAVYLGTSDETIPILLAHPEKAHLIIPIVGLKLLIAITGGYLIDILAGHFNNPDVINQEDSVEEVLEEAAVYELDAEVHRDDQQYSDRHPVVDLLREGGADQRHDESGRDAEEYGVREERAEYVAETEERRVNEKFVVDEAHREEDDHQYVGDVYLSRVLVTRASPYRCPPVDRGALGGWRRTGYFLCVSFLFHYL